MATNLYEGGLPEGGANLYPAGDSEGENTGVPGQGGAGRINASDGGPATMNGTYKDQFMDEASYKGDMSIDNDPKMSVCNPDDLSHSDR